MNKLQKKKQLNLNNVYTHQETPLCWSCAICVLCGDAALALVTGLFLAI